MRRRVSLSSLLVGCCAVLACAACCTPPRQDLRLVPLRLTRKGATTLVVVYSRSGSTAAMGLALARLLCADYLRLVGPRGAGDSLSKTPNRHTPVRIVPSHVDLSRYRLILLGSPIWYWRPTAMIYTFIRANRFAETRVVLFYTFRGGLSNDARAEWTRLVRTRGGTVVDFVGIDTKRLGPRRIEDVTTQLVQRQSRWGVLARRPSVRCAEPR